MKFSALLILFSFLFLIFHFSFFVSPAFAQAKTTQTNNYPVSNTTPDVPNDLHNWTQNVMIEVMSALTCQLAGVDPINPKQGCLGIDSASRKIGFLPSPQTGGAIGFMGNMIAALYTPPLHTSDYFQNLAQNFGIVKPAIAQATGTGFQGLSPLIGVWSAFRNIVYLILVIVFVVIGLAIMLRIKIDPRTVMSIQNQIPKIIIGILVVTFSFAIAGFLIDLMWVFIYLIYGIFSGIPGVNLDNFNPANIQGQTALGVGGQIGEFRGLVGVAGISNNIANSITNIISSLLAFDKSFSFASLMTDLIGGVIGGITAIQIAQVPSFTIFGNSIPIGLVGGLVSGSAAGLVAKGALVQWIPWTIAFIIVFIALLFALFRLWFTLIIAYVHILIDVVLAPFWIIGGIVPGSPINLSGWLRDISANLLAFPVTIAMFMLGKVFMDAFGKCPAANPNCAANNFVPPLIGNPGDPSLIGSLIGLGIILMTPNVVSMLKTALKAPKLDTGGVGKAIGISTGILQAPFKPLITGATFLGGQALAKKFIPGLGQRGERPEAAK